MHAPLQQVWPLGQEPGAAGSQTHLPFAHAWPGGQVTPHAPQLAALDVRSTHAPPQQTWLAAQTFPQAPQFVLEVRSAHLPLQQDCPGAQLTPQAPQLPGLDVTSTQQVVWPGGQVPDPPEHCPFWQTVPAGQAWPQAPQLALLVCVSTQIPLQQVVPLGHTAPARQVHTAATPAGAAGPHW